MPSVTVIVPAYNKAANLLPLYGRLSSVADSFSPIRLISYSGIFFSTSGLVYALFVILDTLLFGNPAPGWSSLIGFIPLASGSQRVMPGVVGEYLWRVADEVHGTPLFVIHSHPGIATLDQASVNSWKEGMPERERGKTVAEHKLP